MKKRCVITGLGIVCPVGNDVKESWDSIQKGKTGIAKVTSVDTEGCYANLGGEVFCDDLPAPQYDRSVRLCIRAAQEAIADAGFDAKAVGEAGVIVGSCIGGGDMHVRNFTTPEEGL